MTSRSPGRCPGLAYGCPVGAEYKPLWNLERLTLSMIESHTQFFAALADAGFPVSSVAAIRERFDSLPTTLAELLLAWIPRLDDVRSQESVAWALLAAPKGTLDGAKLAALFDAAASDDLKHALAAVIHHGALVRGIL